MLFIGYCLVKTVVFSLILNEPVLLDAITLIKTNFQQNKNV